MKNTLITGDTGFIGSALVKALVNKNRVFGISRSEPSFSHKNYFHIIADILDPNLETTIKRMPLDVVYHMAGNPLVRDNSSDILRTNVEGTDRLLRCLDDVKFLFASSATVYGNYSPSDHSRIELDRLAPSSHYAVSKVMAEDLVRFYDRSSSVNAVIIRYVAHAGPQSTHGVIHDFVKKLKDPQEEFLEILGSTPGSIKPYIHIDDSVNKTIYLAENREGIWNLSPPDNISVDGVADSVMEGIGISKEKKWLGRSSTWEGDNPYVSLRCRLNGIRDSRQAIIDVACQIKEL